MTTSNPPSPWYAPWRSAAEPEEVQDPADLGTAYGLDLSIDLSSRPRDDAAPAPSTDDARWVQRPGARRRRAG